MHSLRYVKYPHAVEAKALQYETVEVLFLLVFKGIEGPLFLQDFCC